MNTKIDNYLSELIRRCKELGIPRFRLAKLANLHPNTLTKMNDPNWAPAINTLRALERATADANPAILPHSDVTSPTLIRKSA